MFIPLKAYIFQIYTILVGASFILALDKRPPCRTFWGLSYIIGFGVIGFGQWLTFGLEKAFWGPKLIAILILSTLFLCIIRKSKVDYSKSYKANIPGMTMIVIIVLAGFFVTQSNILSETDPRWQWATRAKIIATEDGFQNDFFQDPEIHHINPRYPLLYSAYEGLMLRSFKDADSTDNFRAIPLFFLASFLLLLYGYAKENSKSLSLPIVLLVLISMGKFFSLTVDENYVDFPLGVCAFGTLLVMIDCLKNNRSYILLGLMSAITVGMKSEGIILLGTCTVIALALLKGKNVLKTAASTSIGAGTTLGLHKFCLAQINPTLAMENVTVSDLSLSTALANLDRLPAVLLTLFKYYLDPVNTGAFFVLLILAFFLLQTSESKTSWIIIFSYLTIMTLPFIFSHYRGDNYLLHVEVFALRLLFQIIPIASIVLLSAYDKIDFLNNSNKS